MYSASQRLHEVLAHFGNLPLSQPGNILQVLHLRRFLPRNRLESFPRAKNSWIEIQSSRSRIPHRFQFRNVRLEVIFFFPFRRARKFRQVLFSRFEPALHCREYRCTAAVEESTRHSFQSSELLNAFGSGARNVEQHFVAHDSERRAVELARHAVAPWYELAQKCELATREITRSLDAQKILRLVLFFPFRSLDPVEFFPCPLETPKFLQSRAQLIAQIQEIARVLRSIVEHSRRERTQ